MISSLLQKTLAQLHQQQQKIVLVTGVFDILHQEHTFFLEKAKKLGDFLLVAIESDVRVRQLKGEGRPIHTQEIRRQNLLKLGFADEVIILPENFSQPQDHEAFIAQVRPSTLAVSSHTLHLEQKKAILEKYGGQLIIIHDHNPSISSTKIIQENSMKKTRHILTIIGLTLLSAGIFSACTSPSTQENTAPSQIEKSGDTTKKGKISKMEDKFYLEESGKTPVEINSYGIDLSSYVGQTITVTGQYSGDTLYVGKVE